MGALRERSRAPKFQLSGCVHNKVPRASMCRALHGPASPRFHTLCPVCPEPPHTFSGGLFRLIRRGGGPFRNMSFATQLRVPSETFKLRASLVLTPALHPLSPGNGDAPTHRQAHEPLPPIPAPSRVLSLLHCSQLSPQSPGDVPSVWAAAPAPSYGLGRAGSRGRMV